MTEKQRSHSCHCTGKGASSTKDQRRQRLIIELYVNEVYLGNHNGRAIIGVKQAAKVFGKPLSKLTIGESATIAGIISAPNAYSPLDIPTRPKTEKYYFKRLHVMGWIPEDK